MGLGDDLEATPVEHYRMAARYPLLIENLLDLSHISFLHGSFIEDEAWFGTPVKLTNDGDSYVASRHAADSERSAFHLWMFPDAPERIDQDLRTVFLGPGLVHSGPVVNEAARDGRYLGTLYAIHALTPEYAAVLGPGKAALDAYYETAASPPEDIADAILAALDRADPPFRLIVGADMRAAVEAKLAALAAAAGG